MPSKIVDLSARSKIIGDADRTSLIHLGLSRTVSPSYSGQDYMIYKINEINPAPILKIA